MATRTPDGQQLRKEPFTKNVSRFGDLLNPFAAFTVTQPIGTIVCFPLCAEVKNLMFSKDEGESVRKSPQGEGESDIVTSTNSTDCDAPEGQLFLTMTKPKKL